jgi:xylulokinase
LYRYNVCLVAGGRSIRPALLYSDVRATKEADDILQYLGPERVTAELSNFKGAAACLSKWLWLSRHEPQSLAAAEHMLLGAHSYLAYVLTGGAAEAAACDTTTASTTGLLAPPTLRLRKEGEGGGVAGVEPPRWAEAGVASFEGLDPRLLPRLVDGAAPAPVGVISREVLAALNLPRSLAGVPVFHGVGDLASTTVGAVGLGAGSGGSSSTYMYLGTSGWIAACKPWSEVLRHGGGGDGGGGDEGADGSGGEGGKGREEGVNGGGEGGNGGEEEGVNVGGAASADGVFRLLHPDANLAIVAASMVTAGGNAEWARRTLLPEGASLAQLNAAAAAAPPGSDGLLFLPHLNGERSPFTDPLARGGFVNLSPRSTRNHMCRAVLEGVAYNYRALAESLDIEMPPTPPSVGAVRAADDSPPPSPASQLPPLPLVGGGARSRLWTQTLADVLGRPVKPVADSSTVAARGCAAGAFQYLGLWGGADDSRAGDENENDAAKAAPPPGYFPGDIRGKGGGGGEGEHVGGEHLVVYPDEATRERHEANYAVIIKLHAALASTGVGDLAS